MSTRLAAGWLLAAALATQAGCDDGFVVEITVTSALPPQVRDEIAHITVYFSGMYNMDQTYNLTRSFGEEQRLRFFPQSNLRGRLHVGVTASDASDSELGSGGNDVELDGTRVGTDVVLALP